MGPLLYNGGTVETKVKWNHPKHTILSLISLTLLSGLLAYTNCGSKSGDPGSSYKKQTPFVSTWQTTLPNETITLPLREGYEYNMTVDWGDGSEKEQITSWDDQNKAHEYVDAGEYTITLRGKAEAWYFNACGTDPDTGSEANLLTVEDLGEMGWKNLERAFCGCENLTTFKGGDVSEVTTISGILWSSYNSTPEVSDWNTSKVTDMSHAFDSVSFTGLDLSDWDTSNVTNMSSMLALNSSSQDLRGWDTSKVTKMDHMFLAAGVNSNIAGWNTSKVTTMEQMFYLSSVNPDMSDWNFASITDMTQILIGSQISTINYTKLLKRIHATRTTENVTLQTSSQYYDSAADERTALVNTYGWTISDNGSAGPDPG